MTTETADEQAIIDLAVSYARIVDAGEFAELHDVFTPDATAELGGSGQSGIEEISDRLTFALSRFARWEHHLRDHHVSVEDDRATATCSVHAVHIRPDGETSSTYTVDGTYEDRLVRTPDGWRIAHRSLVVSHRS